MSDYNFPLDDRAAYQRYPKLNWVYNLTRLLSEQHIEWSPFPTKTLSTGVLPFTLDQRKRSFIADIDQPGYIYVAPITSNSVFTECAIIKGEANWMAHYDDDYIINNDVSGAIVLRICAFVALAMPKFNGIVSFETIGNEIYGVKLRPTYELFDSYPPEVAKFFKKIYKKSTTDLS